MVGFVFVFCNLSMPTSNYGKNSVLVHGTVPRPIDSMKEAKFTPKVFEEMERLR